MYWTERQRYLDSLEHNQSKRKRAEALMKSDVFCQKETSSRHKCRIRSEKVRKIQYNNLRASINEDQRSIRERPIQTENLFLLRVSQNQDNVQSTTDLRERTFGSKIDFLHHVKG